MMRQRRWRFRCRGLPADPARDRPWRTGLL